MAAKNKIRKHGLYKSKHKYDTNYRKFRIFSIFAVDKLQIHFL